MNFLQNWFASMMNFVTDMKEDERGSQTLEWIGIAAVVVIVVGVISQAMSGSGIGNDVVEKFSGLIDNIGGGG
ncbi:hypothetical protein [Pontibacillus salipaludis]|uniref:Uncharacterized protein n=1 Tax=Pontibacillus salipaludis TaxID=1697394 RepID=A0ABQ1Q9L6_9BACI|nr:hypothetical protein [Pontibacillus salipaludis]GGD20252.1 hypothetical protein GCM10011389_29860 [Pontibacillus salipaludis]